MSDINQPQCPEACPECGAECEHASEFGPSWWKCGSILYVLNKSKPFEQTDGCRIRQLTAHLAAAEEKFGEVEAWIKFQHNGYDSYAREVMPELKEPATLVQALKELMEEQEALENIAIHAARAAELRADKAEGELAKARGDWPDHWKPGVWLIEKDQTGHGGKWLAESVAALAEVREKRLREDNMRLKAFVLWIFKGFDCDSDGHKYKTYCRTCDAGKLLAALADQGAKS